MAIKYLDAKRIRGTTGSTSATMGTSGDVSEVGGVTLDSTNKVLGSNSIDLDGTDNAYLNMNNILNAMTTTGTISYWVRSEGTSGYCLTFNLSTNAAITYLHMSAEHGQDSGIGLCELQVGGTTQWKVSSGTGTWTSSDRAWHHMVLTQDGTNVKFYWDGTEITSFATTTDKSKWISDLTSRDNVRWGVKNIYNQGNVGEFNGQVDDMAIWTRAITAAEVTTLYGGGQASGTPVSALDISRTGLKAYYSCNSLNGTTLPNEAVDLPEDKATLITTFSDSLGSSADGILVSDPAQDTTPTPPTGLGTSSFHFDGDDAININGAEPFSTTVGSISLWFYNDGTSNEDGILFFGDTDAPSYLGIESRTDGVYAKFRQASGTTSQWEWRTSNNSVTLTDAWHHIVLSQDGTAVKIYVDAVELTTFDASADKSKWMESNIDNGRIGCNSISDNDNANFFTGNIMEVAMWNVALTSAQVTSLYNVVDGVAVGRKANTEPTGLRVYYPLSGTTVTNGLVDYSDLPENTLFEETDTYKTYWLQSNEWRDINWLDTPTWSSDFTDDDEWINSDSRMNVIEGSDWLYFDVRRDNTESTIYRDFGAGNISNTDWRLRFKLVITDLVGGSGSEKSWIFGFSTLTTESITTNCNAIGFGHRSSSSSSERDILIHATDNGNPKDGSNLQEIGTNLLVDDTTYYYELRRIGTTTLRLTLYSDSDYSTVVVTEDRTITAGHGEDMRYFRGVNTTYGSTLAGQVTGYIQDMQFWNGES